MTVEISDFYNSTPKKTHTLYQSASLKLYKINKLSSKFLTSEISVFYKSKASKFLTSVFSEFYNSTPKSEHALNFHKCEKCSF